ncbi:unnamed protein product [Acanthoscelides obtectus]|uniref:Uncharacterized protein n=1 Tax=Acanthoscelides obtectus TaxID=200917 RepID=A0A9P0LY89_ACAOB|nr:unnamed protein product [Acanthoscelides obtectus]CAK1651471.1 hypothetical protein AOBTE_LOCUS17307 [Acanthoscelides obtectus]
MHHPKADIDRLYVPRKRGGRGLTSIHQTCELNIIDLGQYLKWKKYDKLVKLMTEYEDSLPKDHVRDERDVRMAVQSHSMSVAADRQIDGGWGKMTRRQDANAFNRFNAAQ